MSLNIPNAPNANLFKSGYNKYAAAIILAYPFPLFQPGS